MIADPVEGEPLEWIEPLSALEARQLAGLDDTQLRVLLQGRLAQPHRTNAWLPDLVFTGWTAPLDWPYPGLCFRTRCLTLVGYARSSP